MAFSMAWAEARAGAGDEQVRRGAGWRGSAGTCTGAWAGAGMRCRGVRCGAVRAGPGAHAGGAVAGAGVPPRARRGLRRAELRGNPFCAAAPWLPALPLPAWDDGRIRLAVDVSSPLRPDAEASPERLFCHCYARGKGNAQMIPGWPYSWVGGTPPGRTSWTLPLDAVRLGPADDATEATAAQVRDVVTRIIGSGQWKEGDPDIIIVFNAGDDLTRLAWLLACLPVDITGGCAGPGHALPGPGPAARRASTAAAAPDGHKLAFEDPQTSRPRGRRCDRDEPAMAPRRRRPGPGWTSGWNTAAAGKATTANRRHRGHPHPAVRGSPAGERDADRVWLWSSRAAADEEEVNRAWQAFLRRFDSNTHPVPQAASRGDPPNSRSGRRRPWTWLVIACYAELYPARPLAEDIGCPGSSLPAGPLTPARVRRGFRRSARRCPFRPARRAARPGTGRPPGSKNRRPAPARRGQDRQTREAEEENRRQTG